jgi:glycine hydroxymethyltransferase
LLPYDNQDDRENPSGIRIGFQDVTRRGFGKSEIKYLCDLILDIIKNKRKIIEVQKDITALKQNFNIVKYGFHNLKQALGKF